MPSKDSGKNATNNISATLRTEFGKGAARRARRDGLVPAVLYGHASEPRHLALVARDFAAVLRNNGTNAVLTLDIEGEEQVALTKSIVVHPIRRSIEHADLMVLKVGERVTVEVNVVVSGDAEAGSLVTTEATVLEIEADALKIPEQIEISVEEVAIGTQILAGAVVLPEGVTLISDPELLVVNVVPAPTDEELEAEGAGTAEIGDEPDEIQTEDDAEGDSSDES